MTNFWDERYGTDEYAYGVEPNDFLRAEAHRIPPGPVLCLAEGDSSWRATRTARFTKGASTTVPAPRFSSSAFVPRERANPFGRHLALISQGARTC